ncbi:uncharacterized protein LOC128741594 [Sabethes cyaneus]|uniref:uncharacterized protein LOC128741594 n=1 Tax=Sabethes cyaneus TaxID=53552 RepID=UPI00237D4105|nr:uncharacterized protein LOC128741594 [Sabethes cyaneus]XP_053693618.1 uncharacterized protein LOC128741594 [Sabethes cyaneus]
MNSDKLHINDLPDEVLRHIFAFRPQLESRKPLSLVCRRWNDVAFDYSYLGHIKLNWMLGMDSVKKQHKILRCYRIVHLRCMLHGILDEADAEEIVALFENPSSTLQEFVYNEASRGSLALKLLFKCPHVKKVYLPAVEDVPDDKLPVLNELEELVIPSMSKFNIIHLAPNLRKLEARNDLYDLPMAIQKLPLEHLQVNLTFFSADLFQKSSNTTKLTTVELLGGYIDQKSLEQLCRVCPLLTKLRVCVRSKSTSLQCLASLTYLKVVGLHDVSNELFANSDVCLSSVETVELDLTRRLHFGEYLQQIFPSVHHLKFTYSASALDWDLIEEIGIISNGFPHLKTLEYSQLGQSFPLELLEGLSDLRELIVNNAQLSGSDFPPMTIEQLTLKECELVVTDEMEHNLPNLQFLNLHGIVRITDAEKLPSSCTIRRFGRNRSDICGIRDKSAIFGHFKPFK